MHNCQNQSVPGPLNVARREPIAKTICTAGGESERARERREPVQSEECDAPYPTTNQFTKQNLNQPPRNLALPIILPAMVILEQDPCEE